MRGPPTFAEVREHLEAERAEGRRVQRRVQLPLVCAGIASSVLGCVLYATQALAAAKFGDFASVLALHTSVLLMICGVWLAVCSILPNNRRWQYMLAVVIAIGAVLVCASNVMQSFEHSRALRLCAGLSRVERSTCEPYRRAYLAYRVADALVLACTAISMVGLLVFQLRPRAMRLAVMQVARASVLAITVTAFTFHTATLVIIGSELLPSVFVVFIRETLQLLLFTIGMRPASTRRMQAWLSAHTVTASAASAIAAMLGTLDPEELQERSLRTFRCVSLGQIQHAHIVSSVPDPRLNALTVPATFGQVDAFISHSWHDDADAKWAALQRWHRAFRQRYNRDAIVWLDRVCVDQQEIDDAIACLPVYIAGCRTVLVLTGKTYFTRLWCWIELLCYFEMGGEPSTLQVVELEDAGDWQSTLNVRQATCSREADRDHLLGVIEAGFGDLDTFSAHVSSELLEARSVPYEQLVPSPASPARKYSAWSRIMDLPTTPTRTASAAAAAIASAGFAPARVAPSPVGCGAASAV